MAIRVENVDDSDYEEEGGEQRLRVRRVLAHAELIPFARQLREQMAVEVKERFVKHRYTADGDTTTCSYLYEAASMSHPLYAGLLYIDQLADSQLMAGRARKATHRVVCRLLERQFEKENGAGREVVVRPGGGQRTLAQAYAQRPADAPRCLVVGWGGRCQRRLSCAWETARGRVPLFDSLGSFATIREGGWGVAGGAVVPVLGGLPRASRSTRSIQNKPKPQSPLLARAPIPGLSLTLPLDTLPQTGLRRPARSTTPSGSRCRQEGQQDVWVPWVSGGMGLVACSGSNKCSELEQKGFAFGVCVEGKKGACGWVEWIHKSRFVWAESSAGLARYVLFGLGRRVIGACWGLVVGCKTRAARRQLCRRCWCWFLLCVRASLLFLLTCLLGDPQKHVPLSCLVDWSIGPCTYLSSPPRTHTHDHGAGSSSGTATTTCRSSTAAMGPRPRRAAASTTTSTRRLAPMPRRHRRKQERRRARRLGRSSWSWARAAMRPSPPLPTPAPAAAPPALPRSPRTTARRAAASS